MNKNLITTLVGAVVAVLTILTSVMPPDSMWKKILDQVGQAMTEGPLHDALLLGGGVLISGGLGRFFSKDPTAAGKPPTQS